MSHYHLMGVKHPNQNFQSKKHKNGEKVQRDQANKVSEEVQKPV